MVRTDFYDAVVERVREVEWDVEGRFLICETRAFGSFPKLAIVNVYAVVSSSPTLPVMLLLLTRKLRTVPMLLIRTRRPGR